MSHQILLHHLNASRSQRLFWLLEELGLPYKVRVHFRNQMRQAPKSLKDVSPIGKAPVVELDGETITESGYIIHRLLKLAPSSADIETTPSNDSFGAMVQASSGAWVGGLVGELNDDAKEGVKKYAGWFNDVLLRSINETNLQEMEEFLSKNPGKYFSGTDKPGAGDFQMFFPLYSLMHGTRKGAYQLGPGLLKYWEMVMARPAVTKGLDRLAKEEESAKAKI